jgi:glyoxylase-like metal-dependent hydrolase (beta-lactamase superfamily II)/rhodanese-related sulfurtransferase
MGALLDGMSHQGVSDPPTVTARALADRLARGEDVTVVDLRDRDEFETWRIDGPTVTAHQIPSARFVTAQVTDDLPELVADVDEPMVVVCAVGEASAEAASNLEAAGIDAVHLAGGMDAWARVLCSVEIETTAGTLLQYERPATGCLSYLLVSGDEGVVVDPLRAFTDRYARDATDRGARLRYAIDTHVHADHVSGVRDVARGTDAEPVLPERARERGLEYGVRPLAAGEHLAFGDASLRAVGLPGHTSEMTGLEYGDVLLVGDSVFIDGVARPDLEAAAATGDTDSGDLARALHRTVTETIGTLPPSTRLFPAHHALDEDRAPDGAFSTTVDGVHDVLDRIGRDEDAFIAAVQTDATRPNNYETIIDVNLGRSTVDDANAFELELGPNNCAAN